MAGKFSKLKQSAGSYVMHARKSVSNLYVTVTVMVELCVTWITG